jgi:hypothetical protein
LVSFFFRSLRFAFLGLLAAAFRCLPVVTKCFLEVVPMSAVHPTCWRCASTEQPQGDWFRQSSLLGSNFSPTGPQLKAGASSFGDCFFAKKLQQTISAQTRSI